MEVFLELLVLLVLTRAFGEAAERLGQPASAGEILAGVMLAAVVTWFGESIPFAAQLVSSDVLGDVANVGIFFLVLLAGIEMQPRKIAAGATGSFVVALGGVIVPLIAGFGLAWVFLPESELKYAQALLVGVALSITAIPATIKTFTDLGLLQTRVGEIVVSAALFDDVIGLLLLAILLAVIETGQIPDVTVLALLLAKVAAFFAITIVLGTHVYPRVSRGVRALQAAAVEVSALAAVALAYGLLAEWLGMHWILGGFMAGLYFERSRVGLRAYNEMKLIFTAMTRGVLGPLFFISIGLRVDLSAITGAPVFLLLLTIVAFLGKIAGAGLPALRVGLDRREALAVGVGMSSRGAVELIVISIAYGAGLFASDNQDDPIVKHLFSSLVLIGVITTLLAPVLLRRILSRNPP